MSDDILYSINPADIDGWKAQSRAAGAGDDIYAVTVEGCSSQIVIRRPTKPEWLAYFNASLDPSTAQDAHANLCTKCVLWIDPRVAKARGKLRADAIQPVFATIAAVAADMVAFRLRVVDRIEEVAGWTSEDPLEAPLTRDTHLDVIERLGLDPETASSLVEKYNQSKLVMVSVRVGPVEQDEPERVLFVVRKPDTASFTTFVRDSNKAKEKAEARHALAVACTVYPGASDEHGTNDEAQRVLAKYPGAAAKLCDPIAKLGGANARTTAKKL